MSQLRSDPAFDQFRLSSTINLPLFPLKASKTMANPAVQVAQDWRRLAKAKVANPPSPIRVQGAHDLFQTSALIASGQLFDSSFEPSHGLGSNFTPIGGFPSGKAEPQETAVLRAIHGALTLIHLQFEATRDEPTDAGHHPFTGSHAAHIGVCLEYVQKPATGYKMFKNNALQALILA
jgi:hypothetical protein